MTVYIVLLVLNLLGMAYLFYCKDKQKEINAEFLKHVVVVGAVLDILRQEVDELSNKIGELKTEIDNLKK